MASHVEAVKFWLAECLANHPSCSKKPRFNAIWCSDNSHTVQDLEAESSMPKRLLSFGLNPTGEDVVKVIEVKEVLQYFALSHRWGQNETCTTLKENLGKMMEEGLKVEDLPKTFRDAVQFTREMGYEYLWIDSLCIVQDDAEDWQEEALRMACVYGNSIATITGLSVHNSSTGLYSPSTPLPEGQALEQRAWVLQERMIPPRTFIFADTSLKWECREADATMTAPEMVRREDDGLEHPKDLFTFFRDWRVPNDDVQDDQNMVIFFDLDDLRGDREGYEPFLKAWWKFLGRYTMCHLTKDADRFLAMNGITSTTLRWIHMRHFWGIWSPFILEELGWCVDHNTPSTRPESYLAPSWSWASTRNGRVLNRFYDRLPVRGVLQLKPFVGIPYGTSFDMPLPHPSWRTVSSQGFELKGPLRQGSITVSPVKDKTVSYDITVEPFGRFSDEEAYEFWFDSPQDFPPSSTTDVTLLHVWHYNAEQLNWPEYIDVYLVLQKLNVVKHSRPPLASEANAETNTGVNERSGRLRGNGTIEYEFGEGNTLRMAWNEGDAKDDESEEIYASRTFRRVGYLEATYKKRRDQEGIDEDRWWRSLRVL